MTGRGSFSDIFRPRLAPHARRPEKLPQLQQLRRLSRSQLSRSYQVPCRTLLTKIVPISVVYAIGCGFIYYIFNRNPHSGDRPGRTTSLSSSNCLLQQTFVPYQLGALATKREPARIVSRSSPPCWLPWGKETSASSSICLTYHAFRMYGCTYVLYIEIRVRASTRTRRQNTRLCLPTTPPVARFLTDSVRLLVCSVALLSRTACVRSCATLRTWPSSESFSSLAVATRSTSAAIRGAK